MNFNKTLDSLVYVYIKDRFKSTENVFKSIYIITDPPIDCIKLEDIIDRKLMERSQKGKIEVKYKPKSKNFQNKIKYCDYY